MYRQSLDNLLKALADIEQQYYLTPQVRMLDDQLNVHEDEFTTYENNFTGHLLAGYQVLARLGKLNESRPFLRELQIPKHYAWSEDTDLKVRAAIEQLKVIPGSNEDVINELKTIPDFIIHMSQHSRESEHQLLIAEVKTESDLPYARFAWDFFKLNLYLNKFNFQTACFVAVNTNIATIRSYIARYLYEKHYCTERTQDLFLIIKESYHSEVVVNSLRRTIPLLR